MIIATLCEPTAEATIVRKLGQALSAVSGEIVIVGRIEAGEPRYVPDAVTLRLYFRRTDLIEDFFKIPKATLKSELCITAASIEGVSPPPPPSEPRDWTPFFIAVPCLLVVVALLAGVWCYRRTPTPMNSNSFANQWARMQAQEQAELDVGGGEDNLEMS